jgi:hypothetical protein
MASWHLDQHAQNAQPGGTGEDQPGDFERMAYAARLASGQPDQASLRWIQKGFEAWLRNGGDIPLERCLQLPKSQARMRLMRRNFWLGLAAGLMEHKASLTNLAADLSAELHTFVSRGPWVAWHALEHPPGDASQLRTALFHVARNNDGEALSAKQVHRILRHALR